MSDGYCQSNDQCEINLKVLLVDYVESNQEHLTNSFFSLLCAYATLAALAVLIVSRATRSQESP